MGLPEPAIVAHSQRLEGATAMSIEIPQTLFGHGGGWKALLLLAALLTHTPIPPALGGSGPGNLLLTDLDPKVLPISFSADADGKDVSYQSRAAYKPATVTTGGAKKVCVSCCSPRRTTRHCGPSWSR